MQHLKQKALKKIRLFCLLISRGLFVDIRSLALLRISVGTALLVDLLFRLSNINDFYIGEDRNWWLDYMAEKILIRGN